MLSDRWAGARARAAPALIGCRSRTARARGRGLCAMAHCRCPPSRTPIPRGGSGLGAARGHHYMRGTREANENRVLCYHAASFLTAACARERGRVTARRAPARVGRAPHLDSLGPLLPCAHQLEAVKVTHVRALLLRGELLRPGSRLPLTHDIIVGPRRLEDLVRRVARHLKTQHSPQAPRRAAEGHVTDGTRAPGLASRASAPWR